jgi:hypothetical protein
MATVPESCRVLASSSRAMQSRAEEPLTDSLVWERVKGETGLGKGALRLPSVSLRVLMLKLPFSFCLSHGQSSSAHGTLVVSEIFLRLKDGQVCSAGLQRPVSAHSSYNSDVHPVSTIV